VNRILLVLLDFSLRHKRCAAYSIHRRTWKYDWQRSSTRCRFKVTHGVLQRSLSFSPCLPHGRDKWRHCIHVTYCNVTEWQENLYTGRVCVMECKILIIIKISAIFKKQVSKQNFLCQYAYSSNDIGMNLSRPFIMKFSCRIIHTKIYKFVIFCLLL